MCWIGLFVVGKGALGVALRCFFGVWLGRRGFWVGFVGLIEILG